MPADRCLDTLVLYVAGVDVTVAQTALVRSRNREELVLGVCLIVCKREVETVVEECTVETNLDRVGLLWLQCAERSLVGS